MENLDRELDELKRQGLYRQPRLMEAAAGPRGMVGGKPVLNFSSNNYLDLAAHPAVVETVTVGVRQWGWGTGGSRLISGNQSPHEHLQERLAAWLDKEACLIFNSGYQANTALLGTLAGPEDLIVLDKLSHASLLDGAQHSGAKVRIFPHGQTDKIVRLLERGGFRQAFIVTDSIFSMDGDLANLGELVKIKERFGATLIVDEAHALGCLGPEGRGYAAELGLLGQIDIVVGTLSKALGSMGGFVAAARPVIEYLANRARGFIYTTALPAAACLGAMAALEIIRTEPQQRQTLLQNAEYLRQRCQTLGLNIGRSQSYIVPVILGSAERTVAVSQGILERGFLTAAVRPPTVAPESSRLRISLMCSHAREDIDQLCEALANCGIR